MTNRASILLVEDDGDIRESIREVLEDEGYAVLEALDGLDALEQLRAVAHLPGLILLDLMMPRMNGAEFLIEREKTPTWSQLPVVILSADADVRAKARLLEVAAYLEKPIKLALLLATIARVIEASRG